MVVMVASKQRPRGDRYPDDIYDRVWNPSTPEGYRFLTSNTTVVDTSNVTDSPPQAMLRSAIAPIKDSSNISFTVPDLPSAPVHVYYNMYFTEMTSDLAAENASRRSFMFYVDGQLFYSTEIVPEYGIAFQLYSLRNEASNNTKYDLQRAADASALPPIISGLEYYVVYDVNQFTLEEDVQALSALQEHFKVLQEWTGDPCLPEEYNWEWVVCAHFTTPRIITLNLSGYGLSGSLPDFSGLSFLKIIDLSNNSFTGDFPDFLAKLPELKYLNLADNDFGSIPISLRNNTTIELNISGNQLLKNVLSPPPSPTNGDINVEVAELLINIIVLFATIMVYHIYP